MMVKLLIGIIALAILGIGIFLTLSNSNSNVSGNIVAENTLDNSKVIVVGSSHLRFYVDGVENPDIIVNEGDKVRIEFSSQEGFHDFVIDEFNASTEKVSAGNSSVVEFVADKKGKFEYYCSVGKHRANGMFGNFVVN